MRGRKAQISKGRAIRYISFPTSLPIKLAPYRMMMANSSGKDDGSYEDSEDDMEDLKTPIVTDSD